MSVTRRQLFQLGIAGTGVLAAAPWLLTGAHNPAEARALAHTLRPAVRPRSQWANGLAATGRIGPEVPKFLIIHHTASANGYPAKKVPALLRSFYHHHTGTKGWPDVAYNFFVDRYGTVWEGRSGSLAGPVAGSATGGNQGYAQLCCFIGNFTTVPPTPAAQQAMQGLLAWLAVRYEIDLAPQRTVTFISKGSNKWAKGKTIRTAPVAGHRDMSLTACPGDALYGLIGSSLLPGAAALVAAAARPVAPTPHAPTSGKPTPSGPVATPSAAPVATGTPQLTATNPSTAIATPAISTTSSSTSNWTVAAPSAAPHTPNAGAVEVTAPASDLPIWILVGGGSLAVLGAGAMVATRKAQDSNR